MVTLRSLRAGLFSALMLLACPVIVSAEGAFDDKAPPPPSTPEEKAKQLEQLIDEATALLAYERPIDARVKLQQALRLAPQDYRPHMLLGRYYLFDVGHFNLAYRYLKTSEHFFNEQYSENADNSLSEDIAQQHALLLYLVSEAELNLDRYQDSLNTLDRFEKKYWLPFYPGSRAWVLMKLKRVDEAIRVAQSGILIGADQDRTWNILGILFSLKGDHQLSLDAFYEAIRAQVLAGSGEIATPLNNAGEVYREMFKDEFAEAAFVRAVNLPDGCEHILPSLNLAMLDIDELRLRQAERALDDFETCFAQNSLREDTEHRTLLALARGKIALHKSETEKALTMLERAAEEQQWFGKIGTNENDVRFAATISLAQALRARAEELRDFENTSTANFLLNQAKTLFLLARAWWLERRGRQIGLEELDGLEDLSIRNTDTMLEYPTFGSLLAGFNSRSFQKRISHLLATESRKEARYYYQLYLGQNLLAHGKAGEAAPLLESALSGFREFDRLARTQVLASLVAAKEAGAHWWKPLPADEQQKLSRMKEEIYSLSPAHIRSAGVALPVDIRIAAHDPANQALLNGVAKSLLRRRFEAGSGQSRYQLHLSSAPGGEAKNPQVSILLLDKENNVQRASATGTIAAGSIRVGRKTKARLVNTFIKHAFSYTQDAPARKLPELPLLHGIL